MKKFNIKMRLFVMALLAVMFVVASPVDTYAADSPIMFDEEDEDVETPGGNDLNDFSVEIDDNGNLKTSFDNGDSRTSIQELFNKGKFIIIVITGAAMLYFIGKTIVNAMALAHFSGEPQDRKKAIASVLWTLIAAAVASTATILVALSWNAFK